MARILIMSKDNRNWRNGDIVHVIRDDQEWGRLETLDSGFIKVDLTDMSYEEAILLKESTEDGNSRRFQINLPSIERRTGDRAATVTGEITRVYDEVKNNFLIDKEPLRTRQK